VLHTRHTAKLGLEGPKDLKEEAVAEKKAKEEKEKEEKELKKAQQEKEKKEKEAKMAQLQAQKVRARDAPPLSLSPTNLSSIVRDGSFPRLCAFATTGERERDVQIRPHVQGHHPSLARLQSQGTLVTAVRALTPFSLTHCVANCAGAVRGNL
jgi:hypothetical protein